LARERNARSRNVYRFENAIEKGRRLPINLHGMNGITADLRRLRGTSVNQVDNVEHVLVTVGTGCPTSGLILGKSTAFQQSLAVF
jgi:hypothetical protein